MHRKITFREAINPEAAAAAGDQDLSVSSYELTVIGIPDGGLDRFMEEFRVYLLLHYPDFRLGDDLNVYYPPVSPDQIRSAVKMIDLYCVGWAGYNEMDKTPL